MSNEQSMQVSMATWPDLVYKAIQSEIISD